MSDASISSSGNHRQERPERQVGIMLAWPSEAQGDILTECVGGFRHPPLRLTPLAE